MTAAQKSDEHAMIPRLLARIASWFVGDDPCPMMSWLDDRDYPKG